MATFSDIDFNQRGLSKVRHAVLTVGGTWEVAPGTQYPSFVVNGLAQFVNDGLCEEIPVPYPATFGPVNGPLTAVSYAESVALGVAWIVAWLKANPNRTFVLIGYSQGAEVVSRILIRLMSGDLQAWLSNLVGGITFGNPCRGAGFHAPTIKDPGGHGISSLQMAQLPTVNGQVVWADYVHSPANGDAGTDMYGCVPNGQPGQDMTDVYTSVTNLQFHNFADLTTTLVETLVLGVKDLKVGSGLGLGPLALIGLISGGKTTGLPAAAEAAICGLQFLAAQGGPTGPHISYSGELVGYKNLVADAVGFLNFIAALTPARM